MDNKVVQWVTRSTPLESKGTWKKFVQERKGLDNKVAQLYPWDRSKNPPWMAIPSNPEHQKIFLKEFDETKATMHADGGLATPKRGLVDGPGSYSGKVITQSQFEKLWNKFEGRNKEFADLLNKKNFVTATGKKFSDRNVSEYVGYYELDRKPRGDKIFPTTQKKLDKLDKLIVEANNSYKKTPNIGELVKKSGFVQSGKISDMSKTGPGQSLVREKLKKLLTTEQKMENYINNVMLSEDALVKDFYAPSEHLRKKFNISSATYAKFMKKSKAIANNKELFLNLGRVQSFNKYGFNPDGSSKTVSEFSEIITNRVPFSAGHGALREDNATSQILKSAIRNYEKSKAAGKTPKVTFITDPAITPTKDLQFIDNETGRLFSIDPSVEKVEFRGKNYKNNYLNHVDASKLYSKEFGNVYRIYDNDIPKYMAATISDGKGGQIKLDTALRQKLFDRTGSKNYLTRRAVEFDHLDIIDDPFGRKPGNIRLIDRLTNNQAGGIKQAGDVARNKNPQLLKKRLDNIGYNIKDKNVEGLITRLSDNYKKPIKFVSPRTEQNILKRKSIANPKLVRDLLEDLCPNKASGGRVGMKVAGSVGVKCGADRFKQVFKDPSKGTQAERQLVGRILRSSGSAAGRKALYALGPAGIGIDALVEGAIWGDDVLGGASGKEAYNDLWISYLDPRAYTGGLKVSGDRYNETEIAKTYGGDTAKFYKLAHAIEDKYRLENKLQMNEEMDVEGTGITLTPNQRNRLEETNTIIENAGGEEAAYSLLKEDSPLFNAAQISSERFEEVGPGKDWDRKMLAKGPLAQIRRDQERKREMDLYPTYDKFITPSEYKAMDLEQQREAKNVIPELNLTERANIKNILNIPTSDNLSEYVYPGSGISVLDEENLRKKWEYLIDTKGMRGTQDTRYAGGGIAGIRRPHAIPPKSGPMPQGGGLSSQFNRVRKVLGV